MQLRPRPVNPVTVYLFLHFPFYVMQSRSNPLSISFPSIPLLTTSLFRVSATSEAPSIKCKANQAVALLSIYSKRMGPISSVGAH